MLLDRDGHVRQHRWTAGTGDQEQVRKALDGQAEIGLRAVRPDLLERPILTADEIDRQDGSGDRVEAGGEDDGVGGERFVLRVDPRLGDRPERIAPQIHEADVVPVEGGEVVGVEADALGSDRIAARAEFLGDRRVVDRGHDLGAEELGQFVIRGGIGHHVRVDVEQFEQFADLPGTFVALLPFLLRRGVGGRHRALDRDAAERESGRRAVARFVGELFQFAGRQGTVVGRQGEVGGALEDDQFAGLLRDVRNTLDA
ncbi:hypothetical protein MCHUDSM44219_01726 [Mycolicibacterium chubuense]|uniref:Uncharacterized protein n=1 Tax=Mycolicibacterium chubuense TaxID=1800 RepID=A0A0J6WFN6_MYCCU|nr:hypothetical protein MCHUDSM44219_01726 [Mycolicibacterium chubuense]